MLVMSLVINKPLYADETCIALYLYTIVRSVLQNPILHYIRWKHLIILHYTEMIFVK